MKRYLTIISFITSALLHAQTGPGGIGSADGSSALKIWYDAARNVYSDKLMKLKAESSDRVNYWSDISGNNNHVRALFDSTRPTFMSVTPMLNNQPSLRFFRNNGTGNKTNYLKGDFFPTTENVTIYCVFYPISKGGGNNFAPVGSKPSVQGDSLWYSGAGLFNADVGGSSTNDFGLTLTDTSLAAGGGDLAANKDYTVKIPLGLQKPYIGRLEKNGFEGKIAVSKNGEPDKSSLSGKGMLASITYTFIGGTKEQGNELNCFDGYISSIIGFASKLSGAEKIILENHLSAKFDIPLTQKDLYKMDESANGNYDFDVTGIGQEADNLGHLISGCDGIIEISNPTDLQTNEFLFWGHNNQSLNFQSSDTPEGVKQRLQRTWRASETGETGGVDILLDTRELEMNDNQDWVLLTDEDNDGLFDDGQVGKSMFAHSAYLGNGKFIFNNINLQNGSRFTFGILKRHCQPDCDEAFSPNGDGISDTYLITVKGKAKIFDKAGQIVKELHAPAFWDGTKHTGEMVNPGLYFIVSSENPQQTVTVIR